LLALFWFGAGVIHAQAVPTLEVAVSFSHMSVSPTSTGLGNFSLNGGSGQVAYNFSKWISAVADVGYYTMNTQPSNTIGLTIKGTEISYLLGPRISYRRGRYSPFAQVLVGMFHDTPTTLAGTKAQTKLGGGVGGGLDVRIKSYLAVRPIEVDVMRTQFAELGSVRQVQNNIRYSAGLVFRF
jgi:hypothetical protein